MIHRMRLNPVPFEEIKQGKQQIETRLYDYKRRKVKVGDQIKFIKRPAETENLIITVIGLSIFDSFEHLFQATEKTKFGYKESDTLEYQLQCIGKYYSKEDEQTYGVIGIHLKIES